MTGPAKQTTLAACWGMYGVDVPEGYCNNTRPYCPPSPVLYSPSSDSSSAPPLSEVLPIVTRTASRRKMRQLARVLENKTRIPSSPSAEEDKLEIDGPRSSLVNYKTDLEKAFSAAAEEDNLEIDGPDTVWELSGQRQEELLGWVSSSLVITVKTAVLHLLNATLKKYLEEICNGCKISHPSQLQHRCLTVNEEEYFLCGNFIQVLQRLLTPRFVPAVQQLLRSRNIQASDEGVETVALTLLHELKLEKEIHVTIDRLYETMSDFQLAQLKLVDSCYNPSQN